MKTYKEIFAGVPEEKFIRAVRNGMNVYLRRYDDGYRYDYMTFFEAAVRYGTPALVHACIDMGADVNCAAPVKAKGTSPRAVTSSLAAAMNERNAPTLRTLLERGARTGALNGLLWNTQKNFIPEAECDENAKKIKQRLDTGTELLKILREFGFNVPGLGGCEDKDMSLYFVRPLHCLSSGSDKEEEIAGEKYTAWEDWDDEYADGGDDSEDKYDRFCEGMDEWHEDELSFPALGTRPGALWHAASPEALKLMLTGGEDVNARDAAGWTAAHHFSYNCCDDDLYFKPGVMLQILIDSGADVNARGRYGMTPLMLAAMNVKRRPGALETVKLLLMNGADFDAEDEYGRGVRYWMCDYWYGDGFEQSTLDEILSEMYRFAQPDKAKAQAEAEAAEEKSDLSAADIDLMTAAFWRTADGIAPILARGANVNARTRHGFTALMFSSVWNCAPVSQFLIEQGAELGAKNEQDDTALTLAMQTKDLPMIETLLKAGPNLREAAGFGRTPLMTLISNPCCDNMGDLVKELIDAGADVNAKDDEGLTALMYTARRCGARWSDPDIDEARVLLGAGADVNALDNQRRTALEIALNEANQWREPGGFVKFLLSSGADPRLMPLERQKQDGEYERRVANALRRFNLKPRGSFKEVFASNAAEAITAAVESGLDLYLENGDETFFDAVLRYGAPETVQACVDRGVDVNEQWSGDEVISYRTFPQSWPLYKAVAAHNAGAVEVLLKAGANAGIAERLVWHERTNIFPEGSAAGADEAAKALKDRLDAGVKILKMLREAGAGVPYSDGEELTYYSVKDKTRPEHEQGSDADAAADVTAIRRAVSPEALKLLLAAGTDVNAAGPGRRTAMHLIARDWEGYFNPEAMIKILIDAGADANAKGNHGTNVIKLLAAKANDYPGAWKTIVHILEIGAESVKHVKKMRNDILQNDSGSHLARTLRLESFDQGRSPWTREPYGPVTSCPPSLGREATLLERGSGRSPGAANLFIAAGWGSAAEIESALADGAKVNAATCNGYTPLMFASAFNNMEAVQCLLGKGADVDAENSQKETALALAIKAGFSVIAQTLTAAGANVNIGGSNGGSLLFHAGLEETVVALIKAGADLDARNENGDTALKEAMRLSRFKIVRALLAAGADPKFILDDESGYAAENKSERENEREEDKKDNIDNFTASLRRFGLEG